MPPPEKTAVKYVIFQGQGWLAYINEANYFQGW